MSRKDKRPESQPARNTAEEKSRKATEKGIFEEEPGGSQTEGSEERGPDPGQYTDKGSPGYLGR